MTSISREILERDRHYGRVAFLRRVYRVRMRGVLRSFAYILKRRTATAPNMPARKKKRKRGRKRRETKISASRFHLRWKASENARERNEKAREIQRERETDG